jgi:hypothetical protein
MAKTPPIVKDGILTYQQSGSSAQVEVDSADWYTWLETASTFTFRSESGSFTARKEQAGNRRGSLYWRAYRTQDGKLHRVYLLTPLPPHPPRPPERPRSRHFRQPKPVAHHRGDTAGLLLPSQPISLHCLGASRMRRRSLFCSGVQRCAS